MINFLQETDPQSWTKEGENETFILRGESNPVKQAIGIIPQIEDPNVAKQVRRLLFYINMIIDLSGQASEEVDLSNIPPLYAYVEEDGAVSVEWIFPDFRIGFNIEPNPDDSGWHLVAGKNLEDKTESGQLINIPKTLIKLFTFIFSNI